MGNISNKGLGRGRAVLEVLRSGRQGAEREHNVNGLGMCRSPEAACNFFFFFINLEKESGAISWFVSFAII